MIQNKSGHYEYEKGDRVKILFDFNKNGNRQTYQGQVTKVEYDAGCISKYWVKIDRYTIVSKTIPSDIIGPTLPQIGDSICDMHDGIIPPYLEVVSRTIIRSQFGGEFIASHLSERLDTNFLFLNKILYVIDESLHAEQIVCAYSYDACIFGLITLKLKDSQ